MTHLQGSPALAAVQPLRCSAPLDPVEILATFDDADFQPEEVQPPPPAVLVVESEDVLLELFRRILEQRGYRVVVASDAREAGVLMRGDEVDLVVVSIATSRAREMRDVKRIRRAAGDACPMVVVCEDLGTRRTRRGYDAGADYFITRPCRSETIRSIAGLLLDDVADAQLPHSVA